MNNNEGCSQTYQELKFQSRDYVAWRRQRAAESNSIEFLIHLLAYTKVLGSICIYCIRICVDDFALGPLYYTQD
jgi:hypothetical protein